MSDSTLTRLGREEIERLLPLCTDGQIAFFRRLWPGKVSAGDVSHALSLIERAIETNRAEEEER